MRGACGCGGGAVPPNGGGPPSPTAPMLDNKYRSQHESKSEQNANAPQNHFKTPNQRKRARLFFYLKSGVIRHNSEDIRFHTYTTSPDAKGDIKKAFNKLVQDIRRKTPEDMAPYCTNRSYYWAYAGRDVEEPLKFEYAGCKTNEGLGVVHVLVAGDYIPVNYLRDRWLKYHNTPQLKVLLVNRQGDLDKRIGYLLRQYIVGQNLYQHLLLSKNWLYPGAREQFKALVFENVEQHGALGYQIALQEWERSLWLRYPAQRVIDSRRNDKLLKKHRDIHHAKINGSKNSDYYLGLQGVGTMDITGGF